MTAKRIVIELSDSETADSYAMDQALEKVKQQILQGQTEGNYPFFYIDDMSDNEWENNHG